MPFKGSCSTQIKTSHKYELTNKSKLYEVIAICGGEELTVEKNCLLNQAISFFLGRGSVDSCIFKVTYNVIRVERIRKEIMAKATPGIENR